MSVEEQRTGALNAAAGTETPTIVQSLGAPVDDVVVGQDDVSNVKDTVETAEADVPAAAPTTTAQTAETEAHGKASAATAAGGAAAATADSTPAPKPKAEHIEAIFDYRKGHSRFEYVTIPDRGSFRQTKTDHLTDCRSASTSLRRTNR